MARATHIAVNLLLIVTVTMQPSLAYGLQQDCSAGVATGFTCQGCGCCTVQSETAKCPCCSSEATDEEDACCGHGRKNQHRVATFADDPFEGMELQEGPVHFGAKQPSDNDTVQFQAANLAALAAALPLRHGSRTVQRSCASLSCYGVARRTDGQHCLCR